MTKPSEQIQRRREEAAQRKKETPTSRSREEAARRVIERGERCAGENGGSTERAAREVAEVLRRADREKDG